MSTPKLTKDQLETANELLLQIREKLLSISAGNEDFHFALRRKIAKELQYDERGKPTHRRKLKQIKWAEQKGLCPICNQSLPEKYTVLDRFEAKDGYTKENTQLIHSECDVKVQKSRGYK